MQIQEFISLLNGDLALEYAAAIQYRQHGAVINDEYFAFSQELFDHADEELEHAKKIAALITFLGGTPGVMEGPAYVSADNFVMLQQDLYGEETAIARYSDRIDQALENKFYIALYDLSEILSQEASHRTDLKSMLGRA